MFNYENNNGDLKVTKIVAHVLIAIIVLFFGFPLAFGWFQVLSPGEEGVVVRLGQVNRMVGPGFNYKTPFIEDVYVFDTKTQKEQVDSTAASKDLQTVSATIAVNYGLDATKVSNLYSTVGYEYKARVIDPAIQEAVKASTANYTAEELVTKRELVRDDIKTLLTNKLSPYGVTIGDISIINFDFSESFNKAIELKVTAEQDALAAKNKLEQVKYEAQQTVETAKATAEAQRISSQALAAQGGSDYVQLKAIERWDGHLPEQMIPGTTVPFVNLKN